MNDRMFLKHQKKQVKFQRKNSERRLKDISVLSNRLKMQMNADNISMISKYRDISGKKKSKSKSKKKEPIIPSYYYFEMPRPQRKRSEMNEKKVNKKKMIDKINNKSGLINENFNYNKRPISKDLNVEEMIDKFLGKYDLGNIKNKKERIKKKSEYDADNFFDVETKGKIKFKNNENDYKNIDIDKDINDKLDKDIDKINNIDIKDTLDLIFCQ
jgi:hypothetical protein